jgi:hypothetical protein
LEDGIKEESGNSITIAGWLVEQDRLSDLAATAEAGFLTYIRDTERGKAILAKQTRRSRGSSGQPEEEEEEEEDHQLTTRAYMESW